MSNTNFKFHESFAPQIIYLAEILKLASNNYVGSKFNISNITGIPTGTSSGKVIPHIKYLKYMGLIDYSYEENLISLSITALGKVIYEADPFLMQDITKIIMHYNITRINEGAPQWSFLFRELAYDAYSEIQYGVINEKGNNLYGKDIAIGPIKTMYSGEFSTVSPIEIGSKAIAFRYVFQQYSFSNVYAYTLLKEWEELFNNEYEISIEYVLNKIKWHKGFGFDYEMALEVLDEISIRGYIKINKQFNPITIVKNNDSDVILNKLYEDLI